LKFSAGFRIREFDQSFAGNPADMFRRGGIAINSPKRRNGFFITTPAKRPGDAIIPERITRANQSNQKRCRVAEFEFPRPPDDTFQRPAFLCWLPFSGQD